MKAESSTSVEARMEAEVRRLCADHAGAFGKETMESCVAEARKAFEDAGIRDYLPSLVHRYVREVLAASTRAGPEAHTGVPEILFVCVHNAGRSQMAAALTRRLAAGRVAVRTAGSAPAAEIHPAVRQALAEIGLDPAEEFPKPLSEVFLRSADVVVTMGCGDACPVVPGRRYEDWAVTDPAGRPLAEVRRIREEIRARVVSLLTSVGIEPAS